MTFKGFNNLWAWFKVIDSVNAPKWRNRLQLRLHVYDSDAMCSCMDCTLQRLRAVCAAIARCTPFVSKNQCTFYRAMIATQVQESCAIAKMTAQCALHTGALKIFGTAWLLPRPLFPTLSWAFVPIDSMNVPTKFEVRSFTRSWDNRGYPKKFGQSLDTPTLPFLKHF